MIRKRRQWDKEVRSVRPRPGDTTASCRGAGFEALSRLRTLESVVRSGWALALALCLVGCAPTGPSLERYEEPEWVDLGPVVVESMSGQREGVNVRATGVFTHGDDRITLSLEFVLGPPARFVRGTHRSRIAGESTESPVSSESVTFLGGQNTVGSIGGVFLFENPANGSRYRLRFPPTLLARPR